MWTWKSRSKFIDAHFHIPLFAAYGAVAWSAIVLLPPVIAIACVAFFVGYVREVTQVQQKHFDNVIFYGWGQALNFECLYPGALLIIAAIASEITGRA
jgi:hypothetical protein